MAKQKSATVGLVYQSKESDDRINVIPDGAVLRISIGESLVVLDYQQTKHFAKNLHEWNRMQKPTDLGALGVLVVRTAE